MHDIANGWVWFGFTVFLVFALSVDTFILDKKHARPHESMRAALIWSAIWISTALIFNALLWFYLYETQSTVIANTKSLEFFTGYLIEKTLSLDNLFVFYVIFAHLRIPNELQQRVFSYGIWSAIVLRLGIILIGTWLITHFHWILYVMGAFLLLTGIRMLVAKEKEKDLADSLVIAGIKRVFRVTHELDGNKFFIKKNALYYATPLFVALIFIEISDIVFAVDSIPAIFAITQDPFIVWSSNIFAILGLRAMYFLLSRVIARFHLLKYGIALILVFVGFKMVVAPWFEISSIYSLFTIASILLFFTWLSFHENK